ncbi:MAG: helix-turn-helix domain-containing protein [Myxococcota bacterium]
MNAPLNKGQLSDAIIDSHLTGTQKLLLFAYLRHADNKTGLAYPGLKKLSEKAGVGRATAQRHRAALLEWGVLEVVGFTERGGMICRLHLEALPDPQTVQDWKDSQAEARKRKRSDNKNRNPAHDKHPAHDETGTLLTVSIPPAHDEHRTLLTEPSSIEPSSIPPKAPQGGSGSGSLFEASGLEVPEVDPLEVLWGRLEEIRLEAARARGAKARRAPLGRNRRALSARVKEHGEEAIVTVWRWWQHSLHDRATFLRSKSFTANTILRPSKFSGYLEFALEGADPLSETPAPMDADAVITHLDRVFEGPTDTRQAPGRRWWLWTDDVRVHDAMMATICAVFDESDHDWAWEQLRKAGSESAVRFVNAGIRKHWPTCWAAVSDRPAAPAPANTPANTRAALASEAA